ncbi:MAG TPA: hypothetical protein VGK53_24255, partial [Propionicimonas sp.]
MKERFHLKSNRAVVGVVAAVLLAVTAGAGVASAMGLNPLMPSAPMGVPTDAVPAEPDPTVSTPADEEQNQTDQPEQNQTGDNQ